MPNYIKKIGKNTVGTKPIFKKQGSSLLSYLRADIQHTLKFPIVSLTPQVVILNDFNAFNCLAFVSPFGGKVKFKKIYHDTLTERYHVRSFLTRSEIELVVRIFI